MVVFGVLDVAAVCVLGGGVTLLLWAGVRSLRQRRTDAVVVAHEAYASHMTGSSGTRMPLTLHRPVLRFTVDGTEHTVTSRIGSSHPPPVGSSVRVAYPAASPDQAEIDASLARYLVPVVMIGVGLLMVVLFTAVGLAAVLR